MILFLVKKTNKQKLFLKIGSCVPAHTHIHFDERKEEKKNTKLWENLSINPSLNAFYGILFSFM